MDYDNRSEEKECSVTPKNMLKNKIMIRKNLMPLDSEDHQAPLDLSDKSKISKIQNGSDIFINEQVPRLLHQTPRIRVIHHQNLGTVIASPHNHIRGPASGIKVSQISSTNSLPIKQISTASTSTQAFSRSNILTINEIFKRSNSAIESSSLGGISIRQQPNHSQHFYEDPDSPTGLTQSYPYSDEELQRYPKGCLRRQRILQNTLSEEEAFHRVRVINNESSRRYRQRKHIAIKGMKDEEKILLDRQNELKEQYNKLKSECDLYYSHFRRRYF